MVRGGCSDRVLLGNGFRHVVELPMINELADLVAVSRQRPLSFEQARRLTALIEQMDEERRLLRQQLAALRREGDWK